MMGDWDMSVVRDIRRDSELRMKQFRGKGISHSSKGRLPIK